MRLDDGMVVSLGKWDFAVTDEKEEERLRNSIFARRRPAASDEQPKSRYTDYGEITVDLHLEALAGSRSLQVSTRPLRPACAASRITWRSR